MTKIIPDEIQKIFYEHPHIGRCDLAKEANISNQKARFYCQLYREMHRESSKVVKRGVALFDIHYPEHNKECMNIVFDFLKDFKPDYLVLGGDQMDFNCISHHNKGKFRLLENARLNRDYKGFQVDILDKITKNIPKTCKKYFMIGNHEYWVERLVDDNPSLEGLVEVESNLALGDWDIVPFNKTLTIGEINFIHGFYCNKYFAEKNIRVYNKNVFCGHLHTSQVFTITSPLNALPRQGVGIGCLCNKNMAYMHNKPASWVHQFLFWYEFADGSFTYYTPTIINGKCVINNKIYDGNVKK